jgi:hypothetical protein
LLDSGMLAAILPGADGHGTVNALRGATAAAPQKTAKKTKPAAAAAPAARAAQGHSLAKLLTAADFYRFSKRAAVDPIGPLDLPVEMQE